MLNFLNALYTDRIINIFLKLITILKLYIFKIYFVFSLLFLKSFLFFSF